MSRHIYSSFLAALLLALAITGTANAQGCEEVEQPAGESGPVIALASSLAEGGPEEPALGAVVGCNFEPGERVRLDGRLKIGDGSFTALESVAATADSNGSFEATLDVELSSEDYSQGFELEITATGSEGSSAQTRIAAIASGGAMPPTQLPEAGGGGKAARSLAPLTALGLPVVLLLGWAARRYSTR